MTASATAIMANLRTGAGFEWTIVPILVLVLYVYAFHIAKRNWDVVLGAAAFWGMDWINEIWNALVLHFSQFAPAWGAAGKTSYLILVGLNIEISLTFAVAGVVATVVLPADRNLKILGVPNRWFLAVAFSIFAMIVEFFLNSAGALTWDQPWWGRSFPLGIILVGYLPFFVVAYWVHDMKTMRAKLTTLAVIYGIDVAGLVLFGGVLGWI